MKKTILSAIAICIFSFCFSQNPVSPKVWLRADSADAGATAWRDMSGNRLDAVPLMKRMPSAAEDFNFNPCFGMTARSGFTVPGIEIRNSLVTLVIAYRCDDTTAEDVLWTMPVDSEHTIGLTTQNILSADCAVCYDTVTRTDGVINALRLGWEASGRNVLVTDLSVCSGKDLPFSGKLAECVLFDGCPEDTTLLRWESYLAIKYGITLNGTDYLRSDGRVTWDNARHPATIIAGIGRDDTMGLRQTRTLFAGGDILFGLQADMETEVKKNVPHMEDGDFVIMGTDESSLTGTSVLYMQDGTELSVCGQTMVQTTGDAGRHETFLCLGDSCRLPACGRDSVPGNRCIMLIDRSGTGKYALSDMETVFPDSIAPEGYALRFPGIRWDTDGNGMDCFCFAVPVQEEQRVRKTVSATGNDEDTVTDSGDSGQKGFSCSLYPNPSKGDFHVDVTCPENRRVNVKIYTADGKFISGFAGSDMPRHHFGIHVDSPGSYMVAVTSGTDTETFKVLVQ